MNMMIPKVSVVQLLLKIMKENYDFLTECNFFSLKVLTDEKDSENNTKGIRHSIIYFIHTTFFTIIIIKLKQSVINGQIIFINRISKKIFYNAKDKNSRIKLFKANSNQINIPSASTDQR